MNQSVNIYGSTQYWSYGELNTVTDGFGYKDKDGNITWYEGYDQPEDDEFHLSFTVPYGNGCDLSEIYKNNI